ncbi:putative tRNA methyltransferase complex GCD14 subunit [Blattamonas nauphoetae]|uniref:tRNA (adenine(58)-N(1))-methyltransferase n=1 Tax=Blattamonas nauphoetae TaxID=2049346 RepID=A0ABQ9XLF5_9EUKA|nr:putative tRNA methyltransferase complex GCD14 subunit [Blattamonas nauphoetae]
MDTVQEGDQVIVYEGPSKMNCITITKGGSHQNRFGLFDHDDMIGKAYGSKAYSRKGQCYIHLLRPNPELFAIVQEKRTQVLYQADISMIIQGLNILPGKIVLESGTGSGVLSTSIARSVAPTGHLYTFEFNQMRADEARKDFAKRGLSSLITTTHRDVAGEGLSKPEIEGSLSIPFVSPTGEKEYPYADCVFLDIPNPWAVVESAFKVLRAGEGMLCTFSPCIEQVSRNCEEMDRVGFEDVKTIECLVCPIEVKRRHREYLTPWYHPPAFSNFLPSTNQEKDSDNEPSISKEKQNNTKQQEDTPITKQKREESSGAQPVDSSFYKLPEQTPQRFASFALPATQMRTHTGFLTFARKPPAMTPN